MKLQLALVALIFLACNQAGVRHGAAANSDSTNVTTTMTDTGFSFYIPWGDSGYSLSLVLQPALGRGEAETETRPALPAYRVDGDGRCMALNYQYGAYVPAGNLHWFDQGPQGLVSHRAEHPFPSGDILGVDFYVPEGGGLLLLEKAFLEGEEFSRLASIQPEGGLEWKQDRLPGAAFSRIVPGKSGEIYLLRQVEGNEIFRLGPGGQLEEAARAEPGSRLAFAVGLGPALDASLLDGNQARQKVTESAEASEALYYLVGCDGQGNYYAYQAGVVQKVSFDGRLIASMDIKPALEAALGAEGAAGMSFAGILSDLRLDLDGRVYVPCTDEKGMRVVRLEME